MAQVALSRVARYCDRLLRTGEITDYSGAVNGLQVENSGQVSRIAAVVDATVATVRMAAESGADLLIAHHGLFWGPSHPWVGRRYELLKLLLNHNLAVYSSHLPLDLHPKLGNNIQLARALGFKNTAPFFISKGQPIGLKTLVRIDRAELASRLEAVLGGRVIVLPGGPAECHRIGIVTGGAGAEVAQAAAEGVDTFVTGEGPHWSYALAEDLGVNVLYGGHYATETFGVKALAAHLSEKFHVPWAFLDHPTGL
jgi:dinuclear metal center YbgI/SA1388 family protein